MSDSMRPERITLREVLDRLKGELLNAQAEGHSWEACRMLARELAQTYHGDPYVTDTRVRVSAGEWAYVRLRGNGGGDFTCELVELVRDAERAVTPAASEAQK